MEQENRKRAGLAAGLCILAVLFLGTGRGSKSQNFSESSFQETSEAFKEGAAPLEETSRQEEILLTDQEKELLGLLGQALEEGDYESAARLMMEEEEQLSHLYNVKMGGRLWLYEEGEWKEELEGKGLVIKKPGSVYYGELTAGKPQGEGTAFQVVNLDSPRYDYSAGSWEEGRMEGLGTVGYHYYEGTGEENRSVRRTGMFREDLMQGDVTYRTANTEGQVREWSMKIEDGKIVVDESWAFDEEKNVYQLVSPEDQEHAYSLEKERVGEVRFQNLIPW
ncbi:MAG: hypothetical protein HFG70_11495 [Hungatella sp.]|nr:hypothetical protein [Hungatella sp.]